jgi:formylmethanofuran--tetrahydromethanopterin N-formyltransferase
MLKDSVSETYVPKNVNSVYEIVLNGLTLNRVKSAMEKGINAAINVDGVKKITAVNFGGKLGPFKINLKEIL